MNAQIPTPESFLGTPYSPEEDELPVTGRWQPGREQFDPAADKWVPGPMVVVPPDPMTRVAEALESLVETLTGDKQPGEQFTAELVSDGHNPEACPVEQECADLDAKLQTLTQVVVDIEEALGKSKAAPALAAKAVIEAWRNPSVTDAKQEGEEPESVQHGGQITDDPGPVPMNEHPGVEGVPGHTRTPHPEGADFCRECTAETQEWILWPCEAAGAADAVTGGAATQVVDQPVQPAHDAPVEEWRAYARALGYAGPEIDKANRSVIRTTLGIAQPVSS